QIVLIGSLFGFCIPALVAMLMVLFKFSNLNSLVGFVLIYPVAISYAVIKHKLFDIHVLLQKTLVYGLSTVSVAGTFILAVFAINILFASKVNWNNPLLVIGISAFLVLAVNPLKNLVQKFVDTLFFRTNYDYALTISKFSDNLSSLLHINEISNLLLYTISRSLFVEKGNLFIIDKESGVYKNLRSTPLSSSGSEEQEIYQNDTLVEWLYKLQKEIFVEDVISEDQYASKRIDLLRVFADLRASVIFPLLFKSELLGILVLGNKKSGQAYTTNDINFIRTITNQTTIAIENSFSFELVQDYADELEEKNIQLKDVQTQLIQAEKMSAIGHLASGIAHEIRNPLNIIEGARYYLSTIYSNGRENKVAHEYLEYIQTEVVRTNRLIDSLLDFSKYQQSNIENININNVIENVLILSRKQLSDNNIKLIKNLSTNLPTLKGDSNQLWQVVINLLMNSIQAINSARSVSGEGEIVIETGEYSKEDMSNGKHIYLKVMDNGCGIKEGDLSNIFDPFFTKKPDGTGLGLSVSYKIIDAHDGSFFVSSEVGIGTSFMVELPLINKFTGEVVSNGQKENFNS
ncbi:MAG: sensor histidine kinase, partial [Thermodesulfobacteriota bacterium]